MSRKNHPDWNHSAVPWVDSDTLKKIRAAGLKDLKTNEPLEILPWDKRAYGTVYKLPTWNPPTRKGHRDSKKQGTPTCVECESHTCDTSDLLMLRRYDNSRPSRTHTVSAHLVIDDHVLTVNVLFDTGALQGNYLSRDVADWLRRHGATSTDVASRICSAFNDCQLTNNLFTCHLIFNCLDTVCDTVFKLPLPTRSDYVVSDLPTSLRTLGPIDATADSGARNSETGNTTLVLSTSLRTLGPIDATADSGARNSETGNTTLVLPASLRTLGPIDATADSGARNSETRNDTLVLSPSLSALGPIDATADSGAKREGKQSKTDRIDRNQARKRLKRAACAVFHGNSTQTDETSRGTRGTTVQTVVPDETPTGTECEGSLEP